MNWKRILAYITGSVHQELLLRNETIDALFLFGRELEIPILGQFREVQGLVGLGVWHEWGDYPFVYTLAVDKAGHLFAGGNFHVAGTNVTPHIAQANIGYGIAGGRFSTFMYSPVTGLSCTFLDATPGESYRLQTCPALGTGTWADLTNFIYTGPIFITCTSSVFMPNQFYRVISP